MRNFGLRSRSIHFSAAAPAVKAKNHGIAILVTSGIGLIGLSIVIHALAFGFE